jgi:CreA protein
MKVKVTVFQFTLILFALTWIFVGVSSAGPQAVQIDRFMAIDRIGPNNYDLETLRIDDPENPFISIYVTHIIGTGFQFSDPSNVSIACRLTSPIPVDESGRQIVNDTTNHDIAHFRKSIGTKSMRISRTYDKTKNVLIYRAYTTKLFDGSLKHSMSVVPLGMPLTP